MDSAPSDIAPKVIEPLHPLFPDLRKKNSYRIREIVRGTHFDRMTIYRAIALGSLTAIRLGPRTLRVPAVSLLEYINAHIEDPFA
jgi:predicted DNA-binding transcriptional regulator AlpA